MREEGENKWKEEMYDGDNEYQFMSVNQSAQKSFMGDTRECSPRHVDNLTLYGRPIFASQ
jgi:hypothetical protein